MKQLSKADARIVAVHEKGYRPDADGNIYGPTGRKLKLFRIRKEGKPNFQFSATVDQRWLLREGGVNKYKGNVHRVNVNVHRFIEYCKRGSAMFQDDAVVHKDGNKLNVSPENIKACTHKEAGEIRRNNNLRKKPHAGSN
jgi:hypothetical protein